MTSGPAPAEHRIFGPSPGRCWDCGSLGLRAVSDGDQTNFYCGSCDACWHVELGHVYEVDTDSCPGCPAHPCRPA